MRLVSLGDSFSCGEGVGLRIDLPQTWVGLLASALPDCRWADLAVAGATVGDVRAEQLPVALAHRPDLVTLLVGLNDVVRAGFEPAQVAEHLSAVVETLLASGAAVLLVRLHDPGAMLPIPQQLTGPLRRGLAVRVGVLQATVDGLADRPGVHVLDLADVPGLGNAAGWATDRIHPSAIGHRDIAVEASKLLRRAGRTVMPLASAAHGSGGPSAAAQLRWFVAHGLPWTASHARSVALPLLAVAAGLSRRSAPPVVPHARAAPAQPGPAQPDPARPDPEPAATARSPRDRRRPAAACG